MMSEPAFHVQESPAKVFATDAAGTRTELPALWLRERCQEPESLDVATQQRLFNPHHLDEDLTLVEAELMDDQEVRLSFSDGHSGRYDLRHFADDFDDDDGLPAPRLWDSSIDFASITRDWEKIDDHGYFREALETYLRHGVIILKNVPTDGGHLVDVGETFGHVRSTNFGKYFEVCSRPESNDLAYRSVPLAPHTDNPYREPVPGIQLLHCLTNETTGGLSTLVDSLAVAEQLRAEDPEGYRLLSTIPVRFRFIDDGVELIERRPMIHLDAMGKMDGVHYSPRLDYLPLMDEESTKAFHRARRRLGELFAHADYEIQFALGDGELMMFDNNRVLHGRTAYDQNEGFRHLQGCYIDRDGPTGHFRAIVKQERAFQATVSTESATAA
ncbi:gamma-butyrobetaine dioxygenase [Onishia taeanensis]|uniref:Gamma-butyrobetaine dioxygenase n=1 Tax=Onishia taeanensis TaxID=284577 RepID=A0A328XTR6_9GAMM|nr:TauD/TfdA family dioxygenase [Halomonas taeanensis]RAR63521.1 gamma-butyrobetaine dioxygenase [Halomonas taeanensis]